MSSSVTGDVLEAEDPRRIGRYEIVGLLGSGGMGRVYLGRFEAGAAEGEGEPDEAADGEPAARAAGAGPAGPAAEPAEAAELAAVKVIHADLARNPEFRRRFAREVELARRVSGPGHPAVAAVLDADAEADRPWLATEYVPAPSLHSRVTADGPLEPDQVRRLGIGLAEALAGIHAVGLAHRDVKPPNILLAGDGPKLIDFGIARDSALSTMTRTGMVLGTPQAMAPEQLSSNRPRSGADNSPIDVFALGGVLCFAATGEYPFGDGEPTAISYRIVHCEPELSAVPARLRPVIAACLAKDPAARPTAAEVAAELAAPTTHVSATVAFGAFGAFGAPGVLDGEGGAAAGAAAAAGDPASAVAAAGSASSSSAAAAAAAAVVSTETVVGPAGPAKPGRGRRRLALAAGLGAGFAVVVAGALAVESMAGGPHSAEDSGAMSHAALSGASVPTCDGCGSPTGGGTATSTATATDSASGGGAVTPTAGIPSGSGTPSSAGATLPGTLSGGQADPNSAAPRPNPGLPSSTRPPASQPPPPDPGAMPARYLGTWAGAVHITAPMTDTWGNISIHLTAGGPGQAVGTWALSNGSGLMCGGHYVLQNVDSSGTANMSAVVDTNAQGCVNANVHVSNCSCGGHRIYWLANGVIWTQNDGTLTYQHA